MQAALLRTHAALALIVALSVAANHTAADTYNVRLPPYNAIGDGIADDGPSIRAAIAAARAAGGGIVYIPSGTYRIATTHPQDLNACLIVDFKGLAIVGDMPGLVPASPQAGICNESVSDAVGPGTTLLADTQLNSADVLKFARVGASSLDPAFCAIRDIKISRFKSNINMSGAGVSFDDLFAGDNERSESFHISCTTSHLLVTPMGFAQGELRLCRRRSVM